MIANGEKFRGVAGLHYQALPLNTPPQGWKLEARCGGTWVCYTWWYCKSCHAWQERCRFHRKWGFL